jgi:hypothetical protein
MTRISETTWKSLPVSDPLAAIGTTPRSWVCRVEPGLSYRDSAGPWPGACYMPWSSSSSFCGMKLSQFFYLKQVISDHYVSDIRWSEVTSGHRVQYDRGQDMDIQVSTRISEFGPLSDSDTDTVMVVPGRQGRGSRWLGSVATTINAFLPVGWGSLRKFGRRQPCAASIRTRIMKIAEFCGGHWHF